MKLAPFGATGSTGRHIINEALRQGYVLSVYARDAKTLPALAGKVEVVPVICKTGIHCKVHSGR